MADPGIDERAFDRLVEAIDGTPWMSPQQGRIIWRHFAATRPARVLDIGTCFGTSAAYFAGAMQALGIDGTVVTVDSGQFDATTDIVDRCAALWDRCGVAEVVRAERIDHSSYAWWLLQEAERSRDRPGHITPAYDFVYLDGAKLLSLDATSVVLIQRLLAPRRWVLLDDLDWSFADHDAHELPVLAYGDDARYGLSADECSRPQLLALWRTIVETDPAFDRVRIQNGQWGWARKRRRPNRRALGRVAETARQRAVDSLVGTPFERPLRVLARR